MWKVCSRCIFCLLYIFKFVRYRGLIYIMIIGIIYDRLLNFDDICVIIGVVVKCLFVKGYDIYKYKDFFEGSEFWVISILCKK